MKKKLYFLAFLMCFLGALNTMKAQTTVTIDGADEATYSIADNWQGYGASQQIYTATEIGSAGTITKIAFHKADNTNDGNRTWSIYLKEIDATSFTNNSTYPMTSNDLVYSGTFNASSGWVTLDINDFAYNGGNLLVTVLDNSGSKSPGDQKWSYNTSISSKCLVKSQGASIDITLSNQFNVFGGRFSIQLTFASAGGGDETPETPEDPNEGEGGDGGDGNYKGEVSIGDGSTASYGRLPIYTYNFYSCSQQIYTKSEINPDGTRTGNITKIAYKQTNTVTVTRKVMVYMQNTTKGSYSGQYDWVNLADTDKVFDGEVTLLGSDTYLEITLDEPFGYTGGNLLVYVYDYTGSFTSPPANFSVYSSSDRTLMAYNDNGEYTPGSMTSTTGAKASYNNSIVLTFGSVTPTPPGKPTNLTANAISYNTVDLEWTAAENAKKYNVYQGNDKIAENVSGTYFQVTGLDAETNYCFTVTAVNSVGESEHSESECAKTLEEPCNIVFTLKDNYYGSGDGWNGGKLNVSYNGQNTVYTLSDGGYVQYSLEIPQGTEVSLQYNGSQWFKENALIIAYENGKEIVNVGFGNMTQNMSWKFTVDCTVPVPDAPDLTAMALSKSSIRLRWNDVDFATSYNIYNRAGDLLETGLTETSFLFEDLDPETMYCFTVKAINSVGESEKSIEACATTFEESHGCVVIFELTDQTDDWNGCKLVVEYENISRELTLMDTKNETFTMEIPQGTNVTAKFVAAVGSEGNGYPQECGFTIAYESGKEILAVDGWKEYSQSNTTTVTYTFTIDCSNSSMIQIGEGTIGTQNIPVDMFCKYSYSQQSYTRDEIVEAGGFEGYITTIAYHVNYIVGSPKRSLKIFMSNTDNETTFTSTSASYPLSNNTDGLVFDGEVEFASTGWVEIPLMAPFSYNGNHIVITVIDNTGTDAAAYFTTHTKGGDITWTSNNANNDNPIVPTTLSGNINTSRNNIKLRFVPTDAMLEFVGTGSWDITTNWNLRKVPTANDDASIIGDAVITGAAMAKSITIDEGSITLESGSLSVVEGIENNDVNAFVLKDGGQLFQNNADLQGTFVMDINNPTAWSSNNKTGWQFIASPFTNAAVSQFTNTGDEYDLYKFDGRHENITEEWRNHKDASAKFETEFVSGRGYMASYQNDTTATLSGTFYAGTSITYPVTYQDINEGETHWPNFHLLGNPFTFDIDLSKLSMTGMAAGVAMVNNGGTYDYMTTGTIKVGDGFFVKSMAGNPAVSYSNAPTRGGNDDNTSDNISVRVSSSATRDNVVLNFAGSDKAGFPKLNAFNEDAAYLYVVSEEQRYGIFNYDKDVNEVSLSFEVQKMGKYTISVDAEGEYETIVLVDRQTGIETNMLLEDYSFTATSSSKENTDRFLVRFTFRSDVNEDAKHFAYQSGDELIIEAEGTVQLFDVTGRMLYIGEVESHGERINVGHLNNAAYILRLVNEEGVKVQKVIIY